MRKPYWLIHIGVGLHTVGETFEHGTAESVNLFLTLLPVVIKTGLAPDLDHVELFLRSHLPVQVLE